MPGAAAAILQSRGKSQEPQTDEPLNASHPSAAFSLYEKNGPQLLKIQLVGFTVICQKHSWAGTGSKGSGLGRGE